MHQLSHIFYWCQTSHSSKQEYGSEICVNYTQCTLYLNILNFIEYYCAYQLSYNVSVYQKGILSLKGGCTGSSESVNVKMPHCWKSHVGAPLLLSSLQCYSVLSDIMVKNKLCIPLERGLNVLSTGEGFICLSPTSKLKIAVLFCSIYKKIISFSA